MLLFPQPALTRSESFALWHLRQAGEPAPLCPRTMPSGGAGTELARLKAVIQTARMEIFFAPPASLLLTKDERRLLRALEAAQAEDAPRTDHYLYRFTLDAGKRGRLHSAVTELAAWLAVKGFWLPAREGSTDHH